MWLVQVVLRSQLSKMADLFLHVGTHIVYWHRSQSFSFDRDNDSCQATKMQLPVCGQNRNDHILFAFSAVCINMTSDLKKC